MDNQTEPEPQEILPIEPSQEDIAKRAYFIGEHRREGGLPGDAFHDWLQAHKELVEEAKLALTAAAATSKYLEQNPNGK